MYFVPQTNKSFIKITQPHIIIMYAFSHTSSQNICTNTRFIVCSLGPWAWLMFVCYSNQRNSNAPNTLQKHPIVFQYLFKKRPDKPPHCTLTMDNPLPLNRDPIYRMMRPFYWEGRYNITTTTTAVTFFFYYFFFAPLTKGVFWFTGKRNVLR